MPIIRAKYQSDAGTVMRIRLESAKAAITGNAQPTGSITDNQLVALVSNPGSRRKQGVRARGVYFSRVGTGADLNKVFRIWIPCFTQASQTAVAGLASVTYKSLVYTNPQPVGEA